MGAYPDGAGCLRGVHSVIYHKKQNAKLSRKSNEGCSVARGGPQRCSPQNSPWRWSEMTIGRNYFAHRHQKTQVSMSNCQAPAATTINHPRSLKNLLTAIDDYVQRGWQTLLILGKIPFLPEWNNPSTLPQPEELKALLVYYAATRKKTNAAILCPCCAGWEVPLCCCYRAGKILSLCKR